MSAEIRDPRFGAVVGTTIELQQLGTGYGFTEGPVWHPYERHLIFSDMPGNVMRRWTAGGGVVTFRQPSDMANGNTYDAEGRLLTCEHATSRVTRTGLDGAIEVLATHYDGHELNSPNDIVVKSDGSIYFTDPGFGRMPYYGIERPQELGFQGVYRLARDGGDPRLLVDDFGQPNGLCFSLDERQLFINDTAHGHIRVFDVTEDGGLANGRLWASLHGTGEGGADGMKLDVAGNLYCCGPGGVHVYGPDACSLGVIRTPEPVANFTWGEDDLKSLFVTASSSLYRLRTNTPGRKLF